ncbi:MAG: hypothetical protein ACYCOU_02240 [Sulfobacillus sp.]
MPYLAEYTPVRVDLSPFGSTSDGVPFYALVHTFKSVPPPRMTTILQKYPELLDSLNLTRYEQARWLYQSQAYVGAIAPLVIQWNLMDPLTDAVLPIPYDDPTVTERVPSSVWLAIWQRILAPKQPKKDAGGLTVVRNSERK